MKVIVIGGGVIGLSCALFLQETGHEVSVIDKTDMEDGCSYGNAGLVESSLFVPIPSPGLMTKALKWMLKSDSPFYIKPRLNLSLFKWLWYFYCASTEKHMAAVIPAYRDLACLSRSLYLNILEKLPSAPLSQQGLLILYKTEKAKRDELGIAEKASYLNIPAKELTPNEVMALNPNIAYDIIGGIYYPEDLHLTPNQYMVLLKTYLKNKGVTFHTSQSVLSFHKQDRHLDEVITEKQTLQADYFILAAGVWSQEIANKLSLYLPIEPGKGYHIKTFPKHLPKIPAILSETKIAVTPMGNELRLGGTMELSGLNHAFRPNRLNAIVQGVQSYFPEMKNIALSKENIWCGLRPMPPDGVPYIGKTKHYDNLCIATGHGMRGLSLGLGTGSLINALISGQPLPFDINIFSPDRFN